MKHSESIINVMKAVSDLKEAVGPIHKDAKNPYFKSSYASLDNVQEAIDKHMRSLGMTYVQPTDGDKLETLIIHFESGEWFMGSVDMPLKDNANAQDMGSVWTYMKRYSLISTLGLRVGDEDDDGNRAAGKGNNQNNQSNKSGSQPPPPAAAMATVDKDALLKQMAVNTTIETHRSWFGQLTEKQRGIVEKEAVEYANQLTGKSKAA